MEGVVALCTPVLSFWPVDSSFFFRPPILYILHHSFKCIIRDLTIRQRQRQHGRKGAGSSLFVGVGVLAKSSPHEKKS